MRTNVNLVDHRIDPTVRLASGFGPPAAKQDAEALLRRSVMANLLWEDQHYEDGVSVAENINRLVPLVAPEHVAAIAVEARTQQKLRHVPLFLAREMARHQTHRPWVGRLLPQIILRPDELCEFLSLYWKEGKCPLAKQVKIGLAQAFSRFNAYQLQKWNQDRQVRLRDVLFLVHAKPSQEKMELYKQLAEQTLPVADTWEVSLSAGKDKKETWERLITEKKLGVLAFLRNLRGMEAASVSRDVIAQGFETINVQWLLPINCIAAAKAAPRWEREIEQLMFHGLAQWPKLPGLTVLVIDVSGSMENPISDKSTLLRLEVGAALAMLAMEVCEHPVLYVTAGSDNDRMHKTEMLPPRRGFALADMVRRAAQHLGEGGIFTRQCLEYIREREQEQPARILVFSDSQDCDLPDRLIPRPFGSRNYIVDVSAHTRGINYKGLWTAELSGWSDRFLTFIAALEGIFLGQNDEAGDEVQVD